MSFLTSLHGKQPFAPGRFTFKEQKRNSQEEVILHSLPIWKHLETSLVPQLREVVPGITWVRAGNISILYILQRTTEPLASTGLLLGSPD